MIKNLLIDVLGRRKDNFDWRSAMPPLDLSTVDSVCVLHHNDKTGDAILISLLVDALAKTRPDLRIAVGCPTSFASYWSQHPAVAEAIPFDIRRGIYRIRAIQEWRVGRLWRRRFDIVVSFHPFARPEQFALIRGLKPRVAIGFNKDPYRLFDYSLEEHRHGVDLSMIATRTRSVMRLFGHEVNVENLRPHLPFDPSDEAAIAETLAIVPHQGAKTLLNAYGAGREKKLTPASVRRIVEEIRRVDPTGAIFISVPRGEERQYQVALEDEGLDGFTILGPQRGLSSLCALVSAMDVVVSPDTAVGHIAAALGKPQICLFARRGSVPEIWRPMRRLGPARRKRRERDRRKRVRPRGPPSVLRVGRRGFCGRDGS